MQNGSLLVVGAVLALSLSVTAADAWRAPPGADGHADLSGIWEALNTATRHTPGRCGKRARLAPNPPA